MITILFDLDGTLIDSTEAIIEGFGVAYESFGLQKPTNSEITVHIGSPLSVMFAKTGAPDEINDALITKYKAHYRTIATAKTYLLPHAKEALELAASFAKLGVVTTKTAEYSKIILAHLGVYNYFETLVGFEDVINPKPHAEPILTALNRMDIKGNENCFMIGDTRIDVASANSAGISHVAVYSGYESKESLEQVTEIIEKDVNMAVLRIKNRGR